MRVAIIALLVLSVGFSALAKDEPTLREKIGQMLIVGFEGLELEQDNPIVRSLREDHLGGVILYNRKGQRNVESPAQLKKLVASLKAQSKYPLFVSVDMEGGYVCRLHRSKGFVTTVTQQKIALAQRYLEGLVEEKLVKGTPVDLVQICSSNMASDMKEVGINLNLAPVVDVNINPDNAAIGKYERSFSSDASIVSRYALQFIKGQHDKGILVTLKHFPGHGSPDEDSHLELPDITETWDGEAELLPYREIVKAGKADLVMMAHVYHKKLDPKYPATLSRDIIEGLLRKDVGFQGVVISDAMEMKAITDNFGFEEAIILAVNAGVDILLYSNRTGDVVKVLNTIEKAVENHRISMERIDQAFGRIQKLKARIRKTE